jgi:hypothetical protein
VHARLFLARAKGESDLETIVDAIASMTIFGNVADGNSNIDPSGIQFIHRRSQKEKRIQNHQTKSRMKRRGEVLQHYPGVERRSFRETFGAKVCREDQRSRRLREMN